MQADATERIGTKAWAPAGALDGRCKLDVGFNGWALPAITGTIGFHIGNSDNSKRVSLLRNTGTTSNVQAYTYDGGYSAGASSTTPFGEIYLRITRDGANNWSYYWSASGKLWVYVGTAALTLTVANIGFRWVGSVSGTQYAVIDWAVSILVSLEIFFVNKKTFDFSRDLVSPDTIIEKMLL